MPGWVRRGVWNTYARDHPGEMPEEDLINRVLDGLTDDDRGVVARMLELAYEGGVHDTLRVLHDHEVPPFDDAHEGTPFQDFMGRIKGDLDLARRERRRVTVSACALVGMHRSPSAFR